MSATRRVTINLKEAEYMALQRIASCTDRSLAWVGRKAIRDFIEEKESASAPLLTKLAATEKPERQSAR